ncbi:MAG: hypothetical protein RL456_2012 [Pseudomonadota bacterium]|jgi:DNA-binding response OmpR family regulator
MIRIALVEDNPDLRDEIVFHLGRLGHDVVGLPDGQALDRHLAAQEVDVLVLDVGLPGENGFSIAGRMRTAHPMLGIAMLTARGQVEDRLAGFGSGADIYLVKPVDMRELAAVIESLYRRTHRAERPQRQAVWQLDCQTLELISPSQVAIMLTPTEFNLMRELVKVAPETATRAALAASMGHPEFDFDFRRLETALSRLRKKIELRTGDASPLRSARNVGYVFAAPIRLWHPDGAADARERATPAG